VSVGVARASLEQLSSQAETGEAKQLSIVFKADVHGSIEAVVQALTEMGSDEVQIQVIHAGVGDISESDVMLASAANAIIIGFQVRIEPQARHIAEEQGIDVRVYQVIYDIVNDVRDALLGMLEPEYEEAVLGRAEVRQTFRISRVGTVAGCAVTDGVVQRGAKTRVLRGGEVIHEGQVDSLRRLKDDAREVQEGFECGILVGGFTEFEEGDIIEVFTTREVRRETL
jgi:translation initiation factor IF-2